MLFQLLRMASDRRAVCARRPSEPCRAPSITPGAHPAAVQHRGGLGEPRAVRRPPQPRAQLAARLAQDVVCRQLGRLAERARDESELAAVQPRETAAQHAQHVRQHGAARRATPLVGRPAATGRQSPLRPPARDPIIWRPDDGAERRASAARMGRGSRPPPARTRPPAVHCLTLCAATAHLPHDLCTGLARLAA